MSKSLIGMLDMANIKQFGIATTDNSIVDALINHKYSIAKESNIKFKVNLKIPIELPYANADLCVLIGNALDNALEAVLRMKHEKRYIKVVMKCDNDNLLFAVRNSFAGNIRKGKDGSLLTIKADIKNHGMGMHSMQKVVNKYNGIISTSIEKNEFSLDVLLYAPT